MHAYVCMQSPVNKPKCTRWYVAEHDRGSARRCQEDRSTSACAAAAPRGTQGAPQGPPATTAEGPRTPRRTQGAPAAPPAAASAARWPAQRPTQASAPSSCQARYFLLFCAKSQMQQIDSVFLRGSGGC